MNYPTITAPEFGAMAAKGYRYALLLPDKENEFIPVKRASRIAAIARECAIPVHFVDMTLHPYTGKEYPVESLPALGPIIIDEVGEENIYFRIVNWRGKQAYWRGWAKL